jgi:hypothetical protein
MHFGTKTNAQRELIHHKGRLVAKGYLLTKGIDYKNNCACVVKMSSTRVFLAIVVVKDLEVHQLDIKSAIFNNDIKRIFSCWS